MGVTESYQLVKVGPKRSFLERAQDAIRSYWSNPQLSNSTAWNEWRGIGAGSSTGMAVTMDSFLSASPAWAGVTLISDDIAALPLILYKLDPTTGARTRFRTHPLYRLLHDKPNPEMGSFVFRRVVQAHACLGNGYAEIERDSGDRPIALWPLVPWQMSPFRASARAPLQYRYRNESGTEVIYDARDIIHIQGLGPDGSMGYSLVEKAREAVGLALAVERFGGRFFANDAVVGGVISSPGARPTVQSEENQRAKLEARHVGIEKAHKFLMLWGGAKFEPLGVPPNNAQFLETRLNQVREIARFFKLSPHKLGDLERATFNSVEQLNIDHLTSCLGPWITQWNQELSNKLIAPSERNLQDIKHLTQGFLRADTAGRADFYARLAAIGAMTINDIRELEDMERIEGGDTPFVALNTIPLNRLNEFIDAQIAQKTEPKVVSQPPSTDNNRAELEAKIAALEAEVTDRKQNETMYKLAAEEARAEAIRLKDACDNWKRDFDVLSAEYIDVEGKLIEREKAHGQEKETWQAVLTKNEKAIVELNQACEVFKSERDAARSERDELTDNLAERAKELDQSESDFDLFASHANDIIAAARVRHVVVDSAWADSVKAYNDAEVKAVNLRRQIDGLESKARELDGNLNIALMLKQEAEHRADETQARLDLSEAQRRDVTVAIRAVLMDAWQRILYKETIRARKNMTSPEKVRAWVERFYPLHEDDCRRDLRPALRVLLASQGREHELNTVLDEAVQSHLMNSRRQILLAADQSEDEMPAALERVLRRWETERADECADFYLREAER